jgi:flagella basal body P-ring formation protein FlgA
MRAFLIAALFAAALPVLPSQAWAGAPVSLRADTADADGKVTLGDLFDGAGAAADTVVALRSGPTVVLDAGRVQILARRAGLDWDNAQGLRRLIVHAGAVAPTAATAPRGGVDVLVWARNINPGEVVQAQDLTWGKLAGAPADAPQDSDAVVGMEARRPLRAGAAAGLHDVSSPIVIKRDDTVLVTYADGGVRLTLQAKAMGAASVGQTLQVQNISSKKNIQVVATGPDAAAVGPDIVGRPGPASTARYAVR